MMKHICKKNRLFWLTLLILFGVAFLQFLVFHKREAAKQIRTGSTSVSHVDEDEINGRIKDAGGSHLTKTRAQDQETFFVKRAARVTPLDFNFTIRGPTRCQDDKGFPFMVVLVMTVHDHVDQRRAIRETWGSIVRTKQWGKRRVDANIILIFMLGAPSNPSKSALVKKENEESHDIVEASFVDSYFNLTYKVLMGYKWVKEFCPSAQYIVKVDEDTFLNMNLLVNLLGTMAMENTLLGPYFRTAPTVRGGKHGITKESYPLERYPPHVKGNFYTMPSKLAFRVLDLAEYMPYVSIEDVHITGILVKVLGGEHVGVSASAYKPFQHGAPGVCDFMQPFKLAAQKVTPDIARKIWRTILGERECT